MSSSAVQIIQIRKYQCRVLSSQSMWWWNWKRQLLFVLFECKTLLCNGICICSLCSGHAIMQWCVGVSVSVVEARAGGMNPSAGSGWTATFRIGVALFRGLGGLFRRPLLYIWACVSSKSSCLKLPEHRSMLEYPLASLASNFLFLPMKSIHDFWRCVKRSVAAGIFPGKACRDILEFTVELQPNAMHLFPIFLFDCDAKFFLTGMASMEVGLAGKWKGVSVSLRRAEPALLDRRWYLPRFVDKPLPVRAVAGIFCSLQLVQRLLRKSWT